ncbi:MAG: hypothetical protein ABI972_18070 [Acidobacteriota bacterium]
MASDLSQFLVHVDFGSAKGNLLISRDNDSWRLIFEKDVPRTAWNQGKLGFWEWDTSRDVCLLFDNRAQRGGLMGNTLQGASDYIAVGLFQFNPQAATFGFQGTAAFGPDRAFESAARGTWEIVATPDQMGQVRSELEKLSKEIEAAYRQAAIDAIGIVDPTPISDCIGAGMAVSQGDVVGACLSLISVFPYIGDALGKSAKAMRLVAHVQNLYRRLRSVMKSLQLLEREAARARRASQEAWERARVLRRKAEREAADAARRMRTAFRELIKRKYAHVAEKAGWSTADLSRACEWCKYTQPPKMVVARKRSSIALKFEGKAGYAPKSMQVKLKSKKTGPNKGLVCFPTEEELVDVARREGQKSADKIRKNAEDLKKMGYKFDGDGLLIDPRGNKIYSDVDYMGIYNIPEGRTATAWGGRLADNDDPFFIDWVNSLFHGKGPAKQHGNQDRLAMELEGAADDLNKVPGRMPDADELQDLEGFLLIGPDGIPRNVGWTELCDWYKRYGIPNPYLAHM